MSSSPSTARSWLPTRQTSQRSRTSVGAGVGVGAVADHVAEAPDLVDAGASSIAARTASRAGRLEWMSLIDGDAQAASVPGRPLSVHTMWPRDARTDSIAELRGAVERGRPGPARRRADRARARRSTARRSPSSATTAPTRRCCWRRRWATTRATSPSACGAELGARARRRAAASSGSRSPAPASSTSSSPTPGTGGRWRRCSPAGRGPRPGADRSRRSGSWSSSSPPTRPARCTSAAAATPPTATPWCGCCEAVGHEVEREYYVNDAGGQIERFADSIAARMTGERAARGRLRAASTSPSWPSGSPPRGSTPPTARRSARRGIELMLERGAGDARALRRRLRHLVLRARPLRAAARSSRRSAELEQARPHLPQRGRALAADHRLRRRQGPGADPRQRRADLPGRRRRLPLGQARARLRPPDRRARRRPPRLRGADAGRDRGARRRPRRASRR